MVFTYDRNWIEIETMLDKAEKKKNKWNTEFQLARERGDRHSMLEAVRNYKALEGVEKTLKWVLGDKNIEHPLE
jgi:hypothetical protein